MSRSRSHEYMGFKVTATLEWDQGDSDAGIQPGWGENTCVEILAPFSDSAEIVTWITWRDYSFDITRQLSVRYRGRERIEVDKNDPATWVIDDIQTDYRFRRNGVHTLGLTTHVLREQDPGHILRLSELPEVLEVVRAVFADWQAAERLSVAQESLLLSESYLDELRSHEEEDEVIVNEAKLELELDKARAEYEAARRTAQDRGVT